MNGPTTRGFSSTDILINGTHKSLSETSDHRLLIAKITCLCVTSIVGTVANLIICTTLLRRKRKSSEYFILNLAIADLMVCSIGIPLDVYDQSKGAKWPYGSFLCKVIYPAQTLVVLVSIMTLTAMSLERYRAIVTPFKRKFSKGAIMAGIGFIWVLGLAVVAPYAKVLSIIEDKCIEEWPGENDGNYYTLALFIIDYCIPLTIITYCYSRAGFELHKSAKTLYRDHSRRQKPSSQTILLQKRFRRNKRVIKVFSLAVIMFVVCVLPGDCYWMWISFGDGSTFAYENHLQTFVNVLLYANSAINPFIFGAYQVLCFRRTKMVRRNHFHTMTESS